MFRYLSITALKWSSVLVLVLILAGCASIRETTYEAEFDPPRTYVDFMGARLPAASLKRGFISDGVRIAADMGFDVEFVAAVDSIGCEDICFMYRHRNVDDIYIVLTANAAQTRFLRWFHFSPLDSGSP